MAHVRESISVAFVTAVTGLATAGANVFRDRDTDEKPLHATELPAYTVADDGEPAETVTLGIGRLLERRMRVTLTAHVKAASGYSTQLNQMLLEAEQALGNASNLGGAKWANLVDVAAREVSEAADKPTVRQAFTFELFYITAHNAPDVAL